MRDYFIRRFLLIPPTLLGITLIAFFVTRMVPGGPVERALAESQMINMQGGSSSSAEDNVALSEEQIEQLKKLYGLDKPWYIAYPKVRGEGGRVNRGTSFRYQEPGEGR